MSRKVFLNLVIILFLFLVALIPRVYQLNSTEIYPDEITWTVRSRETFLAIKTRRLDYFKTAWWNRKDDTEAINLPSTILSGMSIFFLAKNQPTHYSLNLFPDYIAARIAIAAVNSIFIVLFFLAVRKITGNQKVALLSSFMFSLDPIYLALSRWQLADTSLMIFTFLSLYAYFFIKKRSSSILLSSFFLTLAFLTKPTAVIILLVFLLYSPLKFLYTLVSFILLTKLLWLGSKGLPGVEIIEYLLGQYNLAQGHFTTFFHGTITENPPIYYYLYQIAVRLPLITLFGFIVFPFLYLKRKWFKVPQKRALLLLAFFIFIYIALFSVSSKKSGIRYLLPIFPWIYIISALALEKIIHNFKVRGKILIYSMIVFSELYLALHFFPNYYLYYNVIAGSPQQIQSYDLPNLCMGAKDSILFLEKNYSIKSVAYLGCNKTVIPYYSSKIVTTDWEKEKYVIVEESFRTLSPNEKSVILFKNQKPIYVNSWKGFILSRVYENKN